MGNGDAVLCEMLRRNSEFLISQGKIPNSEIQKKKNIKSWGYINDM